MNEVLRRARLVFWDFDGVIKESVKVKDHALVQLFKPFGTNVMNRVRAHNLANGGMSRFEKIPLYLHWAGQPVTESSVDAFCTEFSRSALSKVIAAPWVPGVEHYLRENQLNQQFVLVSATPIDEIKSILIAIDLTDCFSQVFGSPTKKEDALRQVISEQMIPTSQCLMIGDSTADRDAALNNAVMFLLRTHSQNQAIFKNFNGVSIKDFSSL